MELSERFSANVAGAMCRGTASPELDFRTAAEVGVDLSSLRIDTAYQHFGKNHD
jgi:hypothetical protein